MTAELDQRKYKNLRQRELITWRPDLTLNLRKDI